MLAHGKGVFDFQYLSNGRQTVILTHVDPHGWLPEIYNGAPEIWRGAPFCCLLYYIHRYILSIVATNHNHAVPLSLSSP